MKSFRSHSRRKRQNDKTDDASAIQGLDDHQSLLVRVEGIRIERADKDPSYTEEGIPELLADTKTTIRLFGTGLSNQTVIAFTNIPGDRGDFCDKVGAAEYQVGVNCKVDIKKRFQN